MEYITRAADVHLKYVKEKYDDEGRIVDFDLDLPENFNYAYDIIDEIARLEPDRRALLWVSENGEEKSFTYSDLSRLSNKAANMFLAHGVKKGDKVLCVLKRHYQVYYTVFALCKIGAVVIPATNQLKKKDLTYRIEKSGAKYVVATANDGVPEYFDAAVAECGGVTEKFIVNGFRGGWTHFDSEVDKYPDTLERIENNVNDDMLMFFSSGTTGNPKMVMHGYHYPAAHIFTAKHWHNLNSESLHLSISDSGWAKFFWGKIYGQMALGATMFVYDFDRFHPDKILNIIQKYKITSLCCPPTMLRFFIREDLDAYDLSSLKYATTAGEALNPEVFSKFYDSTGLKLMEGFGQTETICIIGNFPGNELRLGSMGKANPMYEVVIVDENDNIAPVGQTGEICIRLNNGRSNYGLFKCYYGSTDNTGRAKRDNMYHTGDTAYMDEDGYYWYVGRIDDVIKSSGYRIGPFEIESILMEHPAVLEVAVTGVPDPIRGTVVKATIVLTNQYKNKGTEKLVRELQDYVKNTTAPYKYPRIIEFVDELPKTFSGKIRRAEIRERDKKALENK